MAKNMQEECFKITLASLHFLHLIVFEILLMHPSAW